MTQTSNERVDTDSLELSGTLASKDIPDAFQLEEPPQKKVGLEAKKIQYKLAKTKTVIFNDFDQKTKKPVTRNAMLDKP